MTKDKYYDLNSRLNHVLKILDRALAKNDKAQIKLIRQRLKNLDEMRGDTYDYGKFKRGGTVGYTQRWKKARGK